MSWYCLQCSNGPISCGEEICRMCNSPRDSYQCKQNTVGQIFQLASDAATEAQTARKLFSINFADAEPSMKKAITELDQAKAISTDINEAIASDPQLKPSIDNMFEIADQIVNMANNEYLRKKIMSTARTARNARKGGKRRRHKSKKNRRNSRK